MVAVERLRQQLIGRSGKAAEHNRTHSLLGGSNQINRWLKQKHMINMKHMKAWCPLGCFNFAETCINRLAGVCGCLNFAENLHDFRDEQLMNPFSG